MCVCVCVCKTVVFFLHTFAGVIISDPRVEDYLMMSTPWPSLIICIVYIWLVVSALPRFMEHRKPFEIRNLMIVYNFAMVLLSGYIFMEVKTKIYQQTVDTGYIIQYSFHNSV